MSLPLPKAQWLGDIPGHTDATLLAYGQAWRVQALEEAALKADCEGHYWSGETAHAFFGLAEKIRSLK